jgi:hypothetical protein
MAHDATNSVARLVHLDLAGRYSILAAHCNLPLLPADDLGAGTIERSRE